MKIQKGQILFLAVFLVALVCLALFLCFRGTSAPPEPQDAKVAEVEVPGRVHEESGITMVPGIEELSGRLNTPESDPEEDLANLQQLLYLYRQQFGSNPEGGENMLIVEKLLGKNSAELRFLVEDEKHINGNGELIDRWGTPYFFHSISRDVMDILSAGPDTKLWTGDDLKFE